MAKNVGKKFVGVKFECCGVYSRIYFNEEQNAYIGQCPMCRAPLRILVDAQKGVDARFFTSRPSDSSGPYRK